MSGIKRFRLTNDEDFDNAYWDWLESVANSEEVINGSKETYN